MQNVYLKYSLPNFSKNVYAFVSFLYAIFLFTLENTNYNWYSRAQPYLQRYAGR